jgi:hypothetical protein
MQKAKNTQMYNMSAHKAQSTVPMFAEYHNLVMVMSIAN